jgi:methionyl-tRNA formyltransferase
MASGKALKIVFMGSAPFAVPCLDALVESPHDVIEVVTQPCKPAGRGMHMRACAVAEYAKEKGLPLYQPKGVRGPEPIEHFRALNPDLMVVVAYGKILPKELIEIPRMGCINVHASLLPKYRGAAPINWAIAEGERETGVTTLFINEELDAGDMLLAASTPIDEVENASLLHDRLASMGADLLIRTIDGLIDGSVKPTPQDHSKATHAPLMKKDDGHVDWSMSSQRIYDRIRAFTPWPGSFATIGGKKIRVHEAAPIEIDHGKAPGTILECSDHMTVACGEGALCILELQLEGGRRMPACDFLHGHKLKEGDVLR